jgi:HPt (histidine-containing phosphotransfer) domain-containing protein
MVWVLDMAAGNLGRVEMDEYIDPNALKTTVSLHRPEKTELLNRIVNLFKSGLPNAIATMQHAFDALDFQPVRNAAHTLKSSSPYVEAKAFSERCLDMECVARENNFPACIALGDGLDELFSTSCAEPDLRISKAA